MTRRIAKRGHEYFEFIDKLELLAQIKINKTKFLLRWSALDVWDADLHLLFEMK